MALAPCGVTDQQQKRADPTLWGVIVVMVVTAFAFSWGGRQVFTELGVSADNAVLLGIVVWSVALVAISRWRGRL